MPFSSLNYFAEAITCKFVLVVVLESPTVIYMELVNHVSIVSQSKEG